MLYALIIFVTVGPLSDSDSMALTTVQGITSKAACEAAGKEAVSKFATGTKRAAFICVETKA